MALLILLILSAILGAWVLRPLKLDSGLETWCLMLLAGLILSALLILFTGSIALRYTQLFVNIGAAACLAFELFFYSRRNEPAEKAPAGESLIAPLELAACAALALTLLFTFIAALAPVTGAEAAMAHAAVPLAHAREGRIAVDPGNPWSASPQLVYCVYTYLFFQGGETSVTLMNWVFALLACAAIYSVGNRIGGRRTGVIAAAILAATPVFIARSSSVSIDLAFAGIVLTATACCFAALSQTDAENKGLRLRWVCVGAFLAGSSCGVDFAGVIAAALLAIALALYARPRIVFVSIFVAVAAAASAPWLIHASLMGAHVAGMNGARGLRGFLMYPWDVVMRPLWYGGWTHSPGPLAMALGVPGIALAGRKGLKLGAFALAGILACYASGLAGNEGHALPFLCALMVVAALVVTHFPRLRFVVAIVFLCSLAFGLILSGGIALARLPVIVGFEARGKYLAGRVEGYSAFEWMNDRHLPMENSVLSLDPDLYYLANRAYGDAESLRAIAPEPLDAQLEWLKARGIRWLLAPVTRIEEAQDRQDIRAMMDGWRRARRYFVPLKAMDLPRLREEGTERIEIYEIKYE